MAAWLADVFDATVTSMGGPEVWLEPFAGGAGAALKMLADDAVPEAWIVERNPAVAAFWRALAGPEAADLVARVESTTPTLDCFLEARECVATALDGERMERLDLAYAAFVVNRCSRSGMILPNVGPIGGKAQQGRHTVASRFHPGRLAERLRAAAALTDRLRVFEGDGITYIEDLADSGIADEVFVFVDPPYIEVGNGLYAEGMGLADHQRLAAALNECPSPWVLTYDVHAAVPDLYSEHSIREFAIPHTAHRSRVDTELLVMPDHTPPLVRNPLGKGPIWEVTPRAALPARPGA